MQTGIDEKRNYSNAIRLHNLARGNALAAMYPDPITGIATLSVGNHLLHTQALLLNLKGTLV